VNLEQKKLIGLENILIVRALVMQHHKDVEAVDKYWAVGPVPVIVVDSTGDFAAMTDYIGDSATVDEVVWLQAGLGTAQLVVTEARLLAQHFARRLPLPRLCGELY
jgi:hypothetical protein